MYIIPIQIYMHKFQLKKKKKKKKQCGGAKEILWKDHWRTHLSFEILIIDF